MAFRYCYYHVEYHCHPETCCHDEHYGWAVHKLGPQPAGSPFRYAPVATWQFHTSKECEEFMTRLGVKSIGYSNPYERS